MTQRVLRSVCAGLALIVLVILCVQHFRSPSAPTEPKTDTTDVGFKAPKPDLDHPAESYETYLYVLQSGGCDITRPVAITWLDRLASQQLVMPAEQCASVLAMLQSGGHVSWHLTYRQHIFNSAMNALHLCSTGETLTRQLFRLACNDADRTMRLYAMQHLGTQRRIGHLPDSPLATEIYTALNELAGQPNEESSGTALDLLTTWHGENSTITPTLVSLALSTAADAKRPTDVRVSALFAAGAASLDLARQLAADPTQPVLLRKSSLACIGEYGNEADIVMMRTFRDQSSRLAQAAEPAIAQLRKRQQPMSKPKRTPY
jgi:hypothetical protein